MKSARGRPGREAPAAVRLRSGQGPEVRRVLARVDHIVYATPDVDATVDQLESALGVRAATGGRHPAWATRNALIALGDRAYLEIVGPDAEASTPGGPRPYGLDSLRSPRLATWAVRGSPLERLAADAKASGIELGEIQRRTRRRPDGVLLHWTMTDLSMPREGGIIPFFIDWGDTPHPATTSPPGGRLVGLRALHPEATRVRAMLRSLDLGLEVEAGDAPGLIATVETRGGRVELR